MLYLLKKTRGGQMVAICPEYKKVPNLTVPLMPDLGAPDYSITVLLLAVSAVKLGGALTWQPAL